MKEGSHPFYFADADRETKAEEVKYLLKVTN
jgi:hypothetical protein